MKTDIHPPYTALKVTCSCGNTFETRSTYTKETLHIESCQNCNPVYTGKAQGVATGDRINKFKERFAARGK